MSVLPRIGVFSDPRWAGENGHCLLTAAPVPSLTGFGRRFPATDFCKTIPPEFQQDVPLTAIALVNSCW